jgi:hypothetical protein
MTLDRPVEHGSVPRGQLVLQRRPREEAPLGFDVGAVPSSSVESNRFVVAAPHDDRGVMRQQIDHLLGLAFGLGPNAFGISPLQREVLPDEHPEPIGCPVELDGFDVPVDSHDVEPETDHCVERALNVSGSHRTQVGLQRTNVGALELEPFAIDRRDPVAQLDRPKPDAAFANMTGDAGESNLDSHIVHGWFAQAAGPPQVGLFDRDTPFELVLTRRQDVFVAEVGD